MKILKLFLNGIAWGCTVCVFILIFWAAFMGDTLFAAMTAENFIRQAIGSMIVGIGFTMPTLLYHNHRLRIWMQTILHMAIGFLIYFSAAFYLGWIPIKFGWKIITLSLLIAVVTFFAIWSAYYFYNRREAEKLNKKLKDLHQ